MMSRILPVVLLLSASPLQAASPADCQGPLSLSRCFPLMEGLSRQETTNGEPRLVAAALRYFLAMQTDQTPDTPPAG